jgi:hypothetical protein
MYMIQLHFQVTGCHYTGELFSSFYSKIIGLVPSLLKNSILGHLRLSLKGLLVAAISYKIPVSIYHVFLTCHMSSGSLAFGP